MLCFILLPGIVGQIFFLICQWWIAVLGRSKTALLVRIIMPKVVVVKSLPMCVENPKVLVSSDAQQRLEIVLYTSYLFWGRISAGHLYPENK